MKERVQVLPYAFSDGKVYPVEIRFCSVKNLNMRAQGDRVLVKVPFGTSFSRIKTFVSKYEDWLRRRMDLIEEEKQGVFILGKRYPVTVLQGKKGVEYQDEEIVVTVPSGEIEEGKALLKKEYKKRAEEYLKSRAEALYPTAAPVVKIKTLPTINVRYCKSYWGKCFYTRNEIRLSAYLFGASLDVIDYVIFHEYAHFSVHDHSPAFYKTVAKMMPNYARPRKEKKNYPCKSWFDQEG